MANKTMKRHLVIEQFTPCEQGQHINCAKIIFSPTKDIAAMCCSCSCHEPKAKKAKKAKMNEDLPVLSRISKIPPGKPNENKRTASLRQQSILRMLANGPSLKQLIEENQDSLKRGKVISSNLGGEKK